jgi:glutamine synthetase
MPDATGPIHVVFAGVDGRLLEKVSPAGGRTPAFCSSVLLDAANGETVEEAGFGDTTGHPDAYLRVTDDVGRVDWRTGDALQIADIVTASGERHDLCSRSMLRRTRQELSERHDIEVLIGLEVEVFVLPRPIAHRTATGDFRPGAEHRAYFKRLTDPRVVRFLDDVRRAAAAARIGAQFSSSEYAPFQLEFTLGPSDPLRCADDLLLLRQILTECARPHDLYACRVPQPFRDGFGAGLHINITATRAGEPMFPMTGAGSGLPADVLAFANCLESHLHGACAVWNPTVNSYRRLANVEFASTSAFVLQGRRDSLLRVTGHPGDQAARLELRVPDGMANPYAAIAIVLGLLDESIGQATERPETPSRVPESLGSAIAALTSDKNLCDILGERWTSVYRSLKSEEIAWLRRRAGPDEPALGDFVLSAPDIVAGLTEELLQGRRGRGGDAPRRPARREAESSQWIGDAPA